MHTHVWDMSMETYMALILVGSVLFATECSCSWFVALGTLKERHRSWMVLDSCKDCSESWARKL